VHPAVRNVDRLSFTTVRLRSLYDDQYLSSATAFFYAGLMDNEPNIWLVTNWHVLAGRSTDQPHPALHKLGGIPNRIRLNLILKPDQPEYKNAPADQLLFQEQFLDLYDKDGGAFWFQHREGPAYDVGVINFKPLVGRFEMLGINHVATENEMSVQIGNQVFILGYPLGFSHFIETPVWKRGIIASEPHLQTLEGGNRVLLDATTRQGMSGSPVIMREKTHYLSERGKIVKYANATRLIGVYSSRPEIAPRADLDDEDRRAEIGYFYKSGCIHETIVNGVRGPSYGELPA
jgi:hypothetical protein